MVVTVDAYAVTRGTGAVRDLRGPALEEERRLHPHFIQDIQQEPQAPFGRGEAGGGPGAPVEGPGGVLPRDLHVDVAIDVDGEEEALHPLTLTVETLLISIPSMSMGGYLIAVSRARLSLASLSA